MTNGSVEVVRITDLEALEAHAPAWDALCAASPAPEPLVTSTHVWLGPHFQHRVDPDETWACYLAMDDGQLVGVLPVVCTRHPLLGRRYPRLRVPVDIHLRDGDITLAAGRELQVLDELLAALRRHEGPYVELRLGGLRPDSPTTAVLPEASVGSVSLAHDMDGRLLHVRGEWESYHAGLGSNFRRNVRKAANRCKAAGAEVQILSGEDADPAFFERFVSLEASGWKGEAGTAIRDDESRHTFLEAVTRRAAERGWLEWHLLELDGRWIAAHLAIRFGSCLTLLRIAYDESERRLSPGNVLFAEVLKRTFEEQDATVIDCLTDQPWHDNWNLDRVPYRLARIHPRGLVPLLFGALPASVRPLAKRLLGRG